MYCGECGAQFENDDKFCGNCGSSIVTKEEKTKTSDIEPSYNCSVCGKKLKYVENYKRYWCDWCQKYDDRIPSMSKSPGQELQYSQPMIKEKSKIPSYICYTIAIITFILEILV